MRSALAAALDLLPSSGDAARTRACVAGALRLLEAEPARGEPVALTGQEDKILSLIADGYSNHEIALQLHMSINTLKSYVRSAYRKLGVTRRTQAVGWVLRERDR